MNGGTAEMFDSIASRYDLLNRVLSLGIDKRWRRETLRSLHLEPNSRVLDLATGTGDLALCVAGDETLPSVTATDPSTRMLEIARRKIEAAGLSDRISLEPGTAESLPFDDNSFDAVTISFGIRNVKDRPAALREMARVTREGGRVAILELSEPRGGLLGPLARFHIRNVVPRIGALISGAPAYRYLQESVTAFPAPKDFARMMEEAGLEVESIQPLTFGVCVLYVGSPVTT